RRPATAADHRDHRYQEQPGPDECLRHELGTPQTAGRTGIPGRDGALTAEPASGDGPEQRRARAGARARRKTRVTARGRRRASVLSVPEPVPLPVPDPVAPRREPPPTYNHPCCVNRFPPEP